MSPNFPHLIVVVFCTVEACEDSIDIIRIFLLQVNIILLYLDENPIDAGRPEEVRSNMGRRWPLCIFHVQPVQVVTRPEWPA